MNLSRLIAGSLAAWLALAANRAHGQVWLEPRVIEVAQDEAPARAEIRGGRFAPAQTATRAPVVRFRPWRQTAWREISTEPVAPRLAQVSPAPSLGTPEPFNPTAPAPQLAPPIAAPVPAPVAVPGPVIIDYGSPAPMALPPRSCPPWRPCGPQNSFGRNWLVPQGFAGADFRPACQFHDDCLASGCFDRKTCDRMMLAQMDCACNNSMFPLLCRLEARKCYLMARMFGWLWY
jgi:hypothetical protein